MLQAGNSLCKGEAGIKANTECREPEEGTGRELGLGWWKAGRSGQALQAAEGFAM